MRSKASKRNQQRDEDKKFISYERGQQVLIKEHKLSSAEDKQIRKLFLLYRGPYCIVEVHPNNTITVEEYQNKINTYKMKNVKPYNPPDRGKVTRESYQS